MAEIVLLKRRISALENIVKQVASTCPDPIPIIDDNNVRGTRFTNPTVKEYFVITSARIVSLLNCLMLLYIHDFMCEFGILGRALLEAISKQKYVMCGVSAKGLDGRTKSYLGKYFSDAVRTPEKRRSNFDPRQKEIHERIAKSAAVDFANLRQLGIRTPDGGEQEYSEAQSRLYKIFSFVVHGRYPEAMDLFNFDTLELELDGVRGRNKEGLEDYTIELEFLRELVLASERTIQTSILNLFQWSPATAHREATDWAMSEGIGLTRSTGAG